MTTKDAERRRNSHKQSMILPRRNTLSRDAAIARKRRKPQGSFLLLFLIPSLTIVLVGCAGQETIEGQIEVPEGGTLITLVARCKASAPTENARCDNLVTAAQAANAELASPWGGSPNPDPDHSGRQGLGQLQDRVRTRPPTRARHRTS